MRYPIAELLTTTLGFTSAVFKKNSRGKWWRTVSIQWWNSLNPPPFQAAKKKKQKKKQNNMILSIYYRHVFGQFSRCFLVDKNGRMPWISVAIFPSPQLTCFWGNCPGKLPRAPPSPWYKSEWQRWLEDGSNHWSNPKWMFFLCEELSKKTKTAPLKYIHESDNLYYMNN